jgi:hypothetical protein
MLIHALGACLDMSISGRYCHDTWRNHALSEPGNGTLIWWHAANFVQNASIAAVAVLRILILLAEKCVNGPEDINAAHYRDGNRSRIDH